MGNGLAPDVGLSNALHLNGSLDPNGDLPLLQAVRHSQGVDGGGQHPHMVSPGPLHTAGTVLQTTPEVAAAYHNGHLDALGHALAHHIANPADGVKIQAPVLAAGQGLSAEF